MLQDVSRDKSPTTVLNAVPEMWNAVAAMWNAVAEIENAGMILLINADKLNWAGAWDREHLCGSQAGKSERTACGDCSG